MLSIYDKINIRLLSIKSQMEKDKAFIKKYPRHNSVFMLNNDIDKSIVAINQLEFVLEELTGKRKANKFYCKTCDSIYPCSTQNFGIECDVEIKFKNQTL